MDYEHFIQNAYFERNDEAQSYAQDIRNEGGYAWVTDEYATMGGGREFMGYRVNFITLDTMKQHVTRFEAEQIAKQKPILREWMGGNERASLADIAENMGDHNARDIAERLLRNGEALTDEGDSRYFERFTVLDETGLRNQLAASKEKHVPT